MMAAEGMILRRLVPALLECLLLFHVIGYVQSAKGHCIMYGLCAEPLRTSYCVYNGPAKPVQEETRYILDKYCPQYASGPVCCDYDQVNFLKTIAISVAELAFRGCPSCVDNFMQHICGMTCSPNQSEFLNPISVEQFNSTHSRVMKGDYYLSTSYMEATFNSCREVPIIPENAGLQINETTTAIDYICTSRYGAAGCTPYSFFQLIGEPTSSFVLFPINFIVDGRDGYIPFNPPTRQRGSNEQGCQQIKPTTRKDGDSKTDKNSTIPNEFHNFTASENNSMTILNKSHNLTQVNSTERNLDKTGSCTCNCEMLYRQEDRRLFLEADYYSFKKYYMRKKLVLLKEQNDALKDFAEKYMSRQYGPSKI